MGDRGKPSIRIDWFDGSVVDGTQPSTSRFADEEPSPQKNEKLDPVAKKPIGFKRLQDISLMKPSLLSLEVANRPGFWTLFEQNELKGDFMVLILRILASVYKELQLRDNSMMLKLLKTKLLGSTFLDNLIEYVKTLPQVRVVEKKTNMQLWDDVESFYFSVLDTCEGIVKMHGCNGDLGHKLSKLLEAVLMSAIGVGENHLETYRYDLFERTTALDMQIEYRRQWESKSTSNAESSNPNSFKNLNIFPTRRDLFTDNSVNIKPNIINGAYTSVEHYLDLQFKLLREDCFGPLREGICKYIKDPSKRRHENIRVFPKVRVVGIHLSKNKVGHLVDIAWTERQQGLEIKKNMDSKEFMFGSLLLFTSDNFETIFCATVLDSDVGLLRKGYFVVSFQSPISKDINSQTFLMVESEVFFEPYHQVLKVLQNSSLDNMPMKQYIVDVKPEIRPPAYLNSKTEYTVRALNKDIPFKVLRTDQWPKVFDLDESQLEAYKFALTREFVVLQGPPGTGKTFIGVKIAYTLLENLSLQGTPLLVICYTNHALDQFLEGILKSSATKSIVRLGGQSKSEKLEPYSLAALRSKTKCKYSYLYARKREELNNIYKEMMVLQTDIEKCDKGILCYKSIKPYLRIDDRKYELNHSAEDRVLNWLFERSNRSQKYSNTVPENSRMNLEDLNVNESIENCFTEKSVAEEIQSLRKMIKQHKDSNFEMLTGSMCNRNAVVWIEAEIHKIKKRLETFKVFQKKKELYKNCKNKPKKRNNLHELSPEQKWQLYFYVVEEIKRGLFTKMDPLLEKHKLANEELSEVAALVDGDVMRSVRVVGATTAAAAARQRLMNRLMSPIVIVEEAAEVLETHIVASLTQKCQHLIMIGDHKQLRPSSAYYKLAKHYNLDISLFERMITNGVHARTLTTQRRMRPEFKELLVPTIYERLDNHEAVTKYEDVRGLTRNLFFLNHTQFEDTEGMADSCSYRNKFEAKWCVALADYLRQLKYKTEDITILSTYTAQVALIKKLSEKYDSLVDMKITSVDNFQGEESKIVILSLVRSNRGGNIGFLSAANRICVALSRAREGFYIFGNMDILKKASPIWRSIYDKLMARGEIGYTLLLICAKHKQNGDIAHNPEQLKECVGSGGCLKICKKELK